MRDFVLFIRHLFHMLHVLRGVLLILLLFLTVCTIVLILAEKWQVGEALYFVMITGLTVGYGDIVPTTPWGRIASVIAALIGVVLAGIVVATATAALRHTVEDRQSGGTDTR